MSLPCDQARGLLRGKARRLVGMNIGSAYQTHSAVIASATSSKYGAFRSTRWMFDCCYEKRRKSNGTWCQLGIHQQSQGVSNNLCYRFYSTTISLASSRTKRRVRAWHQGGGVSVIVLPCHNAWPPLFVNIC